LTRDRVLITGGGGQLASDLEEQLEDSAEVLAPSRLELDITDDAAVAAIFAEFEPTLLFNCAAFHNLEVCEQEVEHAFAVNSSAVARLADRCARQRTRMIHVSTNYVFDGTAGEPYAEDAIPAPRSIYGISKLSGEHAALTYAPEALVIRTAGLYGIHGSVSKGGNFVQRMVTRARQQGGLAVVADQWINPTFTTDLATLILDSVRARVTGVLHLTNSGCTTWHGFTEAIMEIAGIDVEVEPVATTRPPGHARRPLNGLLRSATAARAGLPAPRFWREALSDYMRMAGLAGLAGAPLVGEARSIV
jgi:dTDP-4-dehydrorhamnose reductase